MIHTYLPLQRLRFRVFPFYLLFFLCCLINSHGQDLNEAILGKWSMVSNGDGFLEATIAFNDDHTYQLDRTWPDASKAGVKGGFLLNSESTPATLRMCLGDCNQAGSEWTSMFCIARATGSETLEIYMSDSGDFPGDFPEDPGSKGMYIFKRSE
jgi:hypothetical protein